MRLRFGVVAGLLLTAAALPASGAAPASKRRLPSAIERSVQAHAVLARRAKDSPEALCELVADSGRLVGSLPLALANLGARTSPDEEQRVFDALDQRVVGVYFVSFDSATRVGVHYAQLAGMAGGDDAALLQAIAELDGVARGIENVPAWIEAMTDYGGCHAPGRATKALTALARSWPAARACLRAALTKPLDELLEQMTRDDNFCQGDPVERNRAASANAAQMRKLEGTRGRKLADELLRRAAQPTSRPPRAPG